jgi:hypothetical protein
MSGLLRAVERALKQIPTRARLKLQLQVNELPAPQGGQDMANFGSIN